MSGVYADVRVVYLVMQTGSSVVCREGLRLHLSSADGDEDDAPGFKPEVILFIRNGANTGEYHRTVDGQRVYGIGDTAEQAWHAAHSKLTGERDLAFSNLNRLVLAIPSEILSSIPAETRR